ncbi:hypothetical protein [Phocaeicola dorei]|uniref:hypothetical protein n=1 Tax=Phocaeicola dorei TaxID=357276 RepID=UPI0034A5533B
MDIKKMYRLITLFFKVNWLKTIIFNFIKLPISQSQYLPILIYKGSKCLHFIRKGHVILDTSEKLSFGMIKLGIKHESCCLSKNGIILDNSGIIIFKGSGVVGNGSVFVIKENAILEIGKNFGITGDFKIHCYNHITIGDYFSCAWNVSLSDTDFHQTSNPQTGKFNSFTKPILIGDGVWVCQNVSITKGTILASFCTVASNSLVNKQYDIEPYSVIGGIPAKLLNIKLENNDIRKNMEIENFKITKGISVFNLK